MKKINDSRSFFFQQKRVPDRQILARLNSNRQAFQNELSKMRSEARKTRLNKKHVLFDLIEIIEKQLSFSDYSVIALRFIFANETCFHLS